MIYLVTTDDTDRIEDTRCDAHDLIPLIVSLLNAGHVKVLAETAA